MPITYIPDEEFHADITAKLDAEGLEGQARETRDLILTETRIGIDQVWPVSWQHLHQNITPEERARRIVNERTSQSLRRK